MAEAPHLEARASFYAAAILGLRALDATERTPRRFGPDADARWEQFKGALGLADRLDLLLRDAAVTWGPAFSPAQAFRIFGLTQDEPFGPDWTGITHDQAKKLLAEATPTAPDLRAIAKALAIQPAPIELPKLTASTRLIVAGGAAVLAVAERFAAQPELSWPDQVLVVSTSGPPRQLAGLAAVILNARSRAQLFEPTEDVKSSTKALGFPSFDAAIVSDDAEPACAAIARSAAGAR